MMNDQLFATPQEIITSDDYYTPEWIFDRLALRFDVDVAAPPGGVPIEKAEARRREAKAERDDKRAARKAAAKRDAKRGKS